MPKSTGQRAHPRGTSARKRLIGRPTHGVVREAAPDLSRDPRRRPAMLDWHRAHGANVSRTGCHFGYSRPTVDLWLGRFDRSRLEAYPRWGSGARACGCRARWSAGSSGDCHARVSCMSRAVAR